MSLANFDIIDIEFGCAAPDFRIRVRKLSNIAYGYRNPLRVSISRPKQDGFFRASSRPIGTAKLQDANRLFHGFH